LATFVKRQGWNTPYNLNKYYTGFEIATIAGLGWGSGLLLSITVSVLLNTTPLAGAGPAIDPTAPIPFLFTLPIPVAVVSWVSVSVRHALNQLDAVTIIERGKLSMEDVGSRQQGKVCLSHNPLSSWVFYLRHRRHSLALLASTGLMVVVVAFPAFIFTMLMNSLWPVGLSYTSHISLVSPAPTYQAVNPAVLAQIRAYPAVTHVIPVKALSMMINVFPVEFTLPVYGVRQGDMQALLDVYDLHVEEGKLPEPRSGQIVLTRALAWNRGLSVGDAIGRPIHEMDSMPTELTITGLLDSGAPGLTKRQGYRIPSASRWVGFVSYEFVEDHERYSAVPMHALVVAAEGHEAEVETWLEESIASPQVKVETFGTVYHSWQRGMQTMILILVSTQSILAVVAAVALAILNTIFVSQRRDEFGILHAVGHSRAGLLARTVQESASIAGAAWLIGAVCCLVFLLGAQIMIYVPRGMSLDLTNPTPWLFTLPIPLATVAANADTIWWALSRLDPVTVIERR
jgi:ABC-type lipoprotein release transport system permease subunit